MPSTDDDAAVFQTLDAMNRIVQRTAADPAVRQAAAAAIAELPAGAGRHDVAQAIWAWVRSHVRFVPDESWYAGAREVLIEPPLLLTMPDPRGDCDDFTMLVLAMLNAVCVPGRPIVLGADPEQPGRFSHVCAETVLEDGSRMTLDASHGPYAGWEAPRHFRRVPWALLNPCGLAGLAAAAAPPPSWQPIALAIAVAGALWIAGKVRL